VNRVRKLTYEERATWGKCPVCQAGPGEWCNPQIGVAMGRTVYGEPPNQGAHMGRLQEAPFKDEFEKE